MNKEINWDEAPGGFDHHIKLSQEGFSVERFAKLLEDNRYLISSVWILNEAFCKEYGTITKRPQKEEPSLMDEDSLQGQLSHSADLLHKLSCSMEDQRQQQNICNMVSQLLDIQNECKLTPEQRLRAKVWDTVAETDIRESAIDSITTDILEKFKLEEK